MTMSFLQGNGSTLLFAGVLLAGGMLAWRAFASGVSPRPFDKDA